MVSKELLEKTLLNIVDNLRNDNSNYTELEMNELLDSINKATNTQNKLSKYQACKYLGISRATFDNWVKSGKLPEGKKEIGFKEKFWLKADLRKWSDNI